MTDKMHFNRRDFVRAGAALTASLTAVPALAGFKKGSRKPAPIPVPRPAPQAGLPRPGSVGSAFVVGTDTYRTLDPLTRAASDARAVAKRLAAIGYRTFEAIEQPRDAILERFAEFKSSVYSGGAAFIYFAGHGLQLKGTNYLLPSDADCSSAAAFERTALSLQAMLEDVSGLRPDQTIAVIDACRNSLDGIDLPDRQNGTSPVAAPDGSYLLFSAGAGQFALDRLSDDDPVANSVFTRHLLPELRPERTIDEIYYNVRNAVKRAAASVLHSQSPVSYNQSARPLRLVPTSAAPAPATATAPPPASPGRMDGAAVLLVAMQSYAGFFVPGENGAESYEGFNLESPRSDVRRLDRAFRALGAETLTLVEPNRETLREACSALRELGRRDLVLYFAGTGGLRGGDGTILIQGNRTDAKGRRLIDYVSSRELAAMLIPERDRCLGRTATLLIDSCLVDHGFKVTQDGPLPLIESLRRGERDDVALLYSAAYGQAAFDVLPDGPPTSPGTQALIELLSRPITIGALAAALRQRVGVLTEGAQTPQLFASPRAHARAFIAAAGSAGSGECIAAT